MSVLSEQLCQLVREHEGDSPLTPGQQLYLLATAQLQRERPAPFDETFATIYADPNWGFDNFGAAKHGAARAHYGGSAAEVIGAVPVQRWSRPSSTLALWACNPKLDEAIDVMRMWGYHLVTSFPWVKTVPSRAELAKGIGFWVHGASEHLLICRRGKTRAPKYPTTADKPDGLLVGEERTFYARRGPHSRKPLSLVEWIEAYLPGPHLELFARVNRPGWTCYGHDTGWHLDHRGATIHLEEVDRG